MAEFDTSRRAHYRITYPVAERPTFEVGRFIHEVIDVSERGLRYEVKGNRILPTEGTEIGGKIQFRRGDEIAVQGTCIRAKESQVVITLNPGLAYAEILAEQRWLRSKGYLLKG